MTRKVQGETEVWVGKKRFFCDFIEPPAHGYLLMGVDGQIHWIPTRNQRVRFVRGSLGVSEEQRAPARHEASSGSGYGGVERVGAVDPATFAPIRDASDPDPAARLAEAKKHERMLAMGMLGVKWGN